MRRLVLVCGFVTVVGCSLPSRDNPRDPAIAPHAALRVVDQSIDDTGACGGQAVDVVGAVPRGHCVVLDASASTDSQGDIDHYEYAYLGTAGFVTFEAAGGSTLVLPGDVKRRNLAPQVAHTLRVTVVDDRGNRDRATATLALLNRPPIALPGPAQFRIAGGPPWDPSVVSYTVDVDGSGSFDPDGDPLTWCWTVPGEAESCAATPERTFAITSSIAQRIAARLRVRDGDADLSAPSTYESVAAETTVEVGALSPWFLRDDLVVERVDWPAAMFDFGTGAVFSRAFQSGEVATAAHLPSDQLIVARAPLSAPTSPSDSLDLGLVGGGVLSLLTDPDRDRIWVLYFGNGGPAACPAGSGPAVVALTGSTVTVEGCARAPWSAFLSNPFAIDADGQAWLGDGLGSTILRIAPDGSVTEIPGDGTVIAGLAQRPGTNEMWQLRSEDLFGAGTGLAAPSRLVRTDPSGTPLGPDVELPANAAFRMDFVDTDRLWISSFDEGLFCAGARALADGASFGDAVIAAFPALRGALELSVDPIDGGAWVDSIAGAFHASPSGETTALGDELLRVHFVDEQGRVWYRAPDGVYVGATPTELGIAADSDETSAGAHSLDLDLGGLWTYSIFTGRIQHIAHDGATSRSLSALTQPGSQTSEAIPLFQRLAKEPGSNSLWGLSIAYPLLSTNGIHRIDLATAERTLVLGSAESAGLSFTVFEASASSDPPFAWMIRGVSPPQQVVTVDATGTEVVRLSLPAGEFVNAAARALSTDDLCVATLSAGVLSVRWVPASGATPLLLAQGSISGGYVLSVGVTDAPQPVCWVGFANTGSVTTDILGWLPVEGGLPSRSVTFGEVLESFAPLAEDELWIARTGGGKERFEWDGLQFNGVESHPGLETGTFLCAGCGDVP